MRESLAEHRSDSRCSGCHNKIDPLGFAMENYDWIGRWRENDPAGPIDPQASLPDGKPLTGVADLKTFLITERSDQFTAALARAMLTYALGRELEYYDEDAIQRIVAEVKANGYRSRTLVKAIARSYPFRFREIQKRATDETKPALTPNDAAWNWRGVTIALSRSDEHGDRYLVPSPTRSNRRSDTCGSTSPAGSIRARGIRLVPEGTLNSPER